MLEIVQKNVNRLLKNVSDVPAFDITVTNHCRLRKVKAPVLQKMCKSANKFFVGLTKNKNDFTIPV